VQNLQPCTLAKWLLVTLMRAQATATIFFKRFYLFKTVLDIKPQDIMFVVPAWLLGSWAGHVDHSLPGSQVSFLLSRQKLRRLVRWRN